MAARGYQAGGHTFKMNYEWLLKIKDSNLLLKRINIRKLQPFPGTEIYRHPHKIPQKVANRFDFYRKKIRTQPLANRISFPVSQPYLEPLPLSLPAHMRAQRTNGVLETLDKKNLVQTGFPRLKS